MHYLTRGVALAGACLFAVSAMAADHRQSVVLDRLTVESDSPDAGMLRLDRDADTASRLGIPLRELPASAEVLDAQTLRERGARTTREALSGAAGFSGGEPPGAPASFSSRGFTGNDITILHDGIRVAEPTMFARPGSVWLYDRIEVLSGPASVLHGEGAVAGAINFVSRRPDPEHHRRDLLLSAGSFGQTWVAAGAGGPTAVEGLSYRVDASRLARDGEIDRSGSRYDSLGASLRYDASARLRFTLSAEAQKDDIEPYFGTPLIDGRIDSRTRRNNYNVADADSSMEGYWLRLDTEYDVTSRLRLRNLTYGYTAERHWRNMETYRYVPEDDEIERSFPLRIRHNQELFGNRLELRHDHRLFGFANRASVGVDMSRNRFRHTNNRPYAGSDRVDPYDPDPGRFASDSPFERGGRTVNDRFALFAEDRLRLTEGLSLVGGLRTELIRIHSTDLREGESFRKSFRPTTGRAGLVWEFVPGLTAYGQYSTGAKPTASTVTFSEARRDDSLERSRAWEAGLRQRLRDGALEWALAVYRIRKENLRTRDPVDPTVERQIGEQRSEGVELRVAAQPHHAWRLEANATALTAEYRDFTTAGGESFAGNTPPNVPERLANLWLTWFATERLTLRADLRYVGARKGDDANTVDVPSYTTVGAAATWSFRDADLTLRGRNLTNERYAEWTSFSGTQWLLGDSRSVDLTLTASF